MRSTLNYNMDIRLIIDKFCTVKLSSERQPNRVFNLRTVLKLASNIMKVPVSCSHTLSQSDMVFHDFHVIHKEAVYRQPEIRLIIPELLPS